MISRLRGGLALLSILALAPIAASSQTTASPTPLAASGPSATSQDAAFGAIAYRYWYGLFALEPTFATSTGLHAYDARLDSASGGHYRELLARDRQFLVDLGRLDPSALTPDDRLDRTLLQNALHDELLIDGRLQLWRHNADGYVGTASGSIYSLIERPFAPATVRLRAVVARENQIPRLLAEAEANLTAVDATTAQIADVDARGAVDFFTHDVPQAMRAAGSARDRAAFARSTETASGAMRGYAAWLEAGPMRHPRGTYAIGPAAYRARLVYEEGIDLPLPSYLAIGERAFADTRAQMLATAHRIDPRATVPQLIARLSMKHPTAEGVLPAAAADLVRLRKFVIDHRIVTLPPNADIRVTATPPFERAFVEAQEDSPGPLERVATRAYYNVTPPDPHDSTAVRSGVLESLNDYERPIISAHEVYPGHYTNFAIDKKLPLSLTRRLATATSFVEGWAHYSEQMMVEQGWGGGDPRVKLLQLDEAILRNARFIVGVKLHTQGMTVREASDFFQHEAFQNAATARAESRRGTQDATYGYYTLGKLEILKLRSDYRKKMGAAFTLQRFHDELLSRGDAPIPLLRPFILGAEDDGNVL